MSTSTLFCLAILGIAALFVLACALVDGDL